MPTIQPAANAAIGGVMARARNIKPGFFINEDLCELEPIARLLFVGLWCVADRDGRLEDRPKRIKMALLPCDDCDVDELLMQLELRNFITRYAGSPYNFIEICNWNKHQNPHHTERGSTIPGPTDQAKALRKKELHGLTVTSPSSPCECLADSLIPDSLIQKPLVNQGTKKHMSSSPQKRDELDGEVCREIFEHWQTVMRKPRAKLDDKRKGLIRRALGSGYSATDLHSAIDGCAGSAWHMGENERGTAFNGLELILRDASKIDAFIAMREKPPAQSRTLTRDEQRANTIAELTGRTRREQGGGNDPFTIDV